MRNCLWCGESFIPKIDSQKYCQESCRYSYRSKMRGRGIRPSKREVDYVVATPYGSAGFDSLVSEWWRESDYPVGMMLGSEINLMRPSVVDAAHRVRG